MKRISVLIAIEMNIYHQESSVLTTMYQSLKTVCIIYRISSCLSSQLNFSSRLFTITSFKLVLTAQWIMERKQIPSSKGIHKKKGIYGSVNVKCEYWILILLNQEQEPTKPHKSISICLYEKWVSVWVGIVVIIMKLVCSVSVVYHHYHMVIVAYRINASY